MGRYIHLFPVCVIWCVVLSGCGTDSRPMLPTAASPTPQPTPAATYTVSGVVSEVVGGQTVSIEGAHVEDSQRHVFVTTAADGTYTLREVGESSLGGAYIYVVKDGFRSQSHQFALTRDTRLDVTLVRQ